MPSKAQLDKAVEYYRKAIATDPAYIIAHGRLGLVLGNQGKYDERWNNSGLC